MTEPNSVEPAPAETATACQVAAPGDASGPAQAAPPLQLT